MVRSHRITRLAVLAGAIAIICGCEQTSVRPDGPPVPSGFTCCNLHYEDDWINDGNYAQLPMIPAGTPARITGYGHFRAHVEIDGKPYRLGLDYGRGAETTEQWAARLIVASDPKVRLATYPPVVRKAIQDGKIMVGMSKEQVIMALGHPLTSENPRLDGPFWRYWRSSLGEYRVHWHGDHVTKVTGDPETVELMLAPGNALPPPAQAAPPAAPASAAPATKSTTKAKGGKKRAKPSANTDSK